MRLRLCAARQHPARQSRRMSLSSSSWERLYSDVWGRIRHQILDLRSFSRDPSLQLLQSIREQSSQQRQEAPSTGGAAVEPGIFPSSFFPTCRIQHHPASRDALPCLAGSQVQCIAALTGMECLSRQMREPRGTGPMTAFPSALMQLSPYPPCMPSQPVQEATGTSMSSAHFLHQLHPGTFPLRDSGYSRSAPSPSQRFSCWCHSGTGETSSPTDSSTSYGPLASVSVHVELYAPA